MPDQAQIRRHADLLGRMAASRGVDLCEQAVAGELSMDEMAEAVLRCTGCGQPDQCNDWLADATGTLPDYCRNRALLHRLSTREDVTE